MEKTLKVDGMHCRSCEMLLAEAVSEIRGVHAASADFRKGTVSIISADAGAIEEAKKLIEREGYRVVH